MCVVTRIRILKNSVNHDNPQIPVNNPANSENVFIPGSNSGG